MNLDRAADLGRSLMDEYSGDMGTGWVFGFDNAVRRFGKCDHNRRRISLSGALTLKNSEEEIRNTILHEIAHAITRSMYGFHRNVESHGKEWKEVAELVGARPVACYSSDDVMAVTPRYVGSCAHAGCHGYGSAKKRRAERYCNYCIKDRGLVWSVVGMDVEARRPFRIAWKENPGYSGNGVDYTKYRWGTAA